MNSSFKSTFLPLLIPNPCGSLLKYFVLSFFLLSSQVSKDYIAGLATATFGCIDEMEVNIPLPSHIPYHIPHGTTHLITIHVKMRVRNYPIITIRHRRRQCGRSFGLQRTSITTCRSHFFNEILLIDADYIILLITMMNSIIYHETTCNLFLFIQ